jgi:hypothetical protein
MKTQQELLRQVEAALKSCRLFAGCEREYDEQLVEDALPLIEKLCQPNIVIVDLDEADTRDTLGRAIQANMKLTIKPPDVEVFIDTKAVLAALKEK